MIYRILKNHKHYVIQKKKWGIWWYVDVGWEYRHDLRFFSFHTGVSTYNKLEDAQETVKQCINYDNKDKKYRIVEVVKTHDSPLFKAVNKDNSEEK